MDTLIPSSISTSVKNFVWFTVEFDKIMSAVSQKSSFFRSSSQTLVENCI